MTRDTQRSRVYDAEQPVRRIFDRADEHGIRELELLGSHITLPIERKFASVESMQAYMDNVLALNCVRAHWDRAAVPVTVQERARHGSGTLRALMPYSPCRCTSARRQGCCAN
ncbi:MAG: TIGR04338 family metallohydrolase [Mycobacterium sp.]